MFKGLHYRISELLNDEILQNNQQQNFIIAFRTLQLVQYLSLTVYSPYSSKDNFHFNTLTTLCKVTLLDFKNIPSYIGYFSSIITLFNLLYFLTLNCYNLNKFYFTKNLTMIYISILPQFLSLLQVSISANALMTSENLFFEQLLGILTIIVIFIQSFTSQLFLRNTYLSQTFLCKDLTLLGLSQTFLQFITLLFHFYDSTESFRIYSFICAFFWALAEYLDLWFNCPNSMIDNFIMIDFCAVKLIFVILSILNYFIKFQEAIVLYGILLGILAYQTSRTIFRTYIYNQFFTFCFEKVNSQYQIFYLKILLFIKHQLNFGEQKMVFLSQKVLILHQKSCASMCQAQVFDNVLECVISKIFEKEEEGQFLYKISYLAFYRKQYSLSLMKIKQYQIHNPHAQSWYFKLMVMNITEHIEKEIQQILYNQTNHDNLSKYTFLTSKDLVEFEQQEIELLPIITQLIVVKIDIWQSQIRGFHDIYRLQDKLIQFSKIIEKIRDKMKIIFDREISDISISLLNNMYQLRILSLYFSVIMNDQLNSYLCEKQIQIVYYFEQTLKQNELTSLALISDKISVISVSMVKKQGEILNTNKQKIGNLFGYHKQSEFNAMLSVNQIIPDFIANIHNEMLTEFLKKGQSSFFVQFKTVFGKNKEYDIVPLQLKFSNDFSYMDDFVIKGVMYQGQKQQDFIIFDDLGHIQGITKSFFENIIKENHKASKIDCETITKQMYIYYFMPEIFHIVVEFQRLKNHSQQVQFLEDTEFMVQSNLIEFHEDFSRSARKFTKHTMSDQIGLYASSYTNCSELTNNNIKSVLRRKMFNEIDRSLLNEEFARSAIKFINNNAEHFMTFLIKFQLSYYPIRNEKVKGFYILEILDYRKNYDKKIGSEIVCKDLDSTMRQSIRIQSNFLQKVEQRSDSEEINNLCALKSNTNTIENLRLETNANSSKRVIFLKPEIMNNINDFIGEEGSESGSDEKQIDYFSPPQSRRLQFCKENDSVHQEGQKHQNKNISEMEMAINQSQSSAVSRQSSRSSNYFYNLFQKKTQYAQNVKVIIIICLLTVIVNLFLCIFNSAKIYSSQQIQEKVTSTMKVPMNLNRYFSKTATLSWITLCSNYGILNISQFQKNQNLHQLSLIDQFMMGNISLIYPSLIDTEDIIPHIDQQQGLYATQEVKLTQFINYMSLFTKQILSNKAEINYDYIEAMIILRYNIKNMHNITSYLMSELNSEYQDAESLMILNQLVSIVINSILIFILFALQLFYFIKIQIQNKSLTLLVGRVKEQELFAEIIKTQYLLSSLKNIAGEDSWKRVNFWSFIFQNDYEQHYKLKLNQQQKTNQKSNLNSRIKHLRIYYEFQLIKIFTQFLIYLSFIWGAYFFFENQNNSISPLVQLDSKYVQFSVNIDVLVFSGLVIKSQTQLYDRLITENIFSQKQILSFDDGKEILILFSSLQDTFSQTMKSLFDDVISTLPNSDDAQSMKNLIDQDICLTLYNQIPFCQLKNSSNQQFVNQYGDYYPYDNDLDYLKEGILGIAAKQASFYLQNYGLELDSQEFNTNLLEVQAVYQTLEFHNIILSHFKDSYLCFFKFLELLNTNISQIRSNNFLYLMLYIYVIGISYFLIFIVYHYFWIMRTNEFIRLLKLSLVVMPNELLSNSSIINNLRKIN